MKKRAILFGIFHYNRSASITANDLPSTEIDVKTLEKRLKQLQFETVSYMDLCLKDMEQKITEFADTAPCDSLNVVYFSGHGGHSKGENYLYPVDFGNSLDARTNLPDNYQLFGKINGRYSFNNIVVKSGNAQIPLSDKISEVYAVDLYSVVPTVSGVDSSIIGEKARNLVGQYVKFSPISGNSIEFHYKK